MSQKNSPPVIDYEGSDYQARFWGQGERAYEDRVEAIALRRLLPPGGGKRLLELGAGAGRNTPRYEKFHEVVLLDYSTTQLAQARQRLQNKSNYRFIAADIYHLPFAPHSFDAATMIRTLHHMADAPLALQQVDEVLCGQAAFILEFASKHNLKAILRYWLGKQKWSPFTLEPVEFVKLNYDFHPLQIRKWLEAAGFRMERQLTVSHFRSGFLKRVIPLKVLVGLDAFLQPSGELIQLTPSVFLRARDTRPLSPVSAQLQFRCPACGMVPLEETSSKMICHQCHQSYPLVEGIYDFRLINN